MDNDAAVKKPAVTSGNFHNGPEGHLTGHSHERGVISRTEPPEWERVAVMDQWKTSGDDQAFALACKRLRSVKCLPVFMAFAIMSLSAAIFTGLLFQSFHTTTAGVGRSTAYEPLSQAALMTSICKSDSSSPASE